MEGILNIYQSLLSMESNIFCFEIFFTLVDLVWFRYHRGTNMFLFLLVSIGIFGPI